MLSRWHRSGQCFLAAAERNAFLFWLAEFDGRVRPAMEMMGWKRIHRVTGRLNVPEFHERYDAVRALRKSASAQKRAENKAGHAAMNWAKTLKPKKVTEKS